MVNLQEVHAQACKMWYVISPGNVKDLMTVMTITSGKYDSLSAIYGVRRAIHLLIARI